MMRISPKAVALVFLNVACFILPGANGQTPGRDRYGDALPAKAVARLGTLHWRHGDTVTSVLFTPDGQGLVSDSQDGTVRLWDLKSGVERRRLANGKQPPARDADQEVAL